jgi:hypothetical protein
MPVPRITNFKPTTVMANGSCGLDCRMHSECSAVLEGDDLADKMVCRVVTTTGIAWDGTLSHDVQGICCVQLTCDATSGNTGAIGLGESGSLTVTVTGNDGTSPPFVTTAEISTGVE